MAKRTKAEIMAGVESVDSKVVANNTVEYHRPDGTRVIRLHRTDILEFKPDGTIVLNSGGWKTVTTKNRLCEYLPLPYKVWQHKGDWDLVNIRSGEIWHYADGMTILPNGTVEGIGKSNAKLRNQINGYVRDFVDKLMAGKIRATPGGDCWYCLMFDKDGDGGTDHLMSHMSKEERYYVPALLRNALDFYPASQAATHQAGFLMGLHDQEANFLNDITKRQMTRSLKQYLYHRFGLVR